VCGCVCVRMCVCACVFVITRVGGVDVRCVLSKIISRHATLVTNIAALSSNFDARIPPPPVPPSLVVPVLYCASRLTATAAHSARTRR
jgi:hypothetical protein